MSMEKQLTGNQIPFCSPEIWGGIECTINRVDNQYFDQLHYAGHYSREGDIDLIADLGIKKLRYPVLWEKHQPEQGKPIDWTWTGRQLEHIRNRNIDVIAGLVHHGSGPAYTNLLDPKFSSLLAAYAKKVAEQFPWINYYTPVNEPLTTARFSGLYGLWYPHHKNTRSFFRMLLTELKGTVLAIQEIRKINPDAKLVQTEDLGKTYSTRKLAYQARFENERRWLTYDILCGRFDEKHKLWKYFSKFAASKEDLYFFLRHPCPPDIFGFNHYLTSERFLDDRLHLYPSATHGGNARHRYADVEAVRVEVEQETGIEVLLKEAWERYGKPMAVTEVHLHCHREEQLRWFKQIWEKTSGLKAAGVDIKAITSWAMLGSYGWNKLLTHAGGDYEPGAFDLRNGSPRPTALSKFIKQIAADKQVVHHLSNEKGWWERSSRLIYEPSLEKGKLSPNPTAPIIIIGKTGTLGKAFARLCNERFLHFHLLGRQDCDISDPASIETAISRYKPWAIINAAGYVRVDEAEKDKEACFKANALGPHNLAIACRQNGIQLINFSSDLVFDGQKNAPYVESDRPGPVNVYGYSKAEAEALTMKEYPSSLLIRTSALFGPWDEYNFPYFIKKSLSRDEPVSVASDLWVSPTFIPHLVNAALDLLIDEESGIWHLANKGAVTWADLAYEVADRLDLDKSFIRAVPQHQLNQLAKRPSYSVLGTEKGQLLPSLDAALLEYFKEEKKEKRKVA
jgi:dTDP-4-dehydrorhamnose reductase